MTSPLLIQPLASLPMMTPLLIQALATATAQWHEASRTYEHASRAFADAQTQLQHAERDLHGLARAIEVAQAAPPIGVVGELVSNQATPLGSVTMPVAPAPAGYPAASSDGVDAAQIVLEEMHRMRMGNP